MNTADDEKFIYLKGQLKGEPLTLINLLSGSKQSGKGLTTIGICQLSLSTVRGY
jgi:hypothetical protein